MTEYILRKETSRIHSFFIMYEEKYSLAYGEKITFDNNKTQIQIQTTSVVRLTTWSYLSVLTDVIEKQTENKLISSENANLFCFGFVFYLTRPTKGKQ